MTEIELLRECLKEQNKVSQAHAEAISKLSDAMRGLVPVAPAVPSDDEVRKAKFEKLYMLWLKQSKFKEFKHSDNVDVCQ